MHVKRILSRGGIAAHFRLGYCLRCMRIAVRAAIAGWLAAAAAHLLPLPAHIGGVAVLVAASLSLLALLHIASFAVRRIETLRGDDRNATGAAAIAPGRRAFVRAFAVGVLAAAAATVPFARAALAACGDCAAQFGAGWLDCITNFCNTVGQTCCPPGYPYLNHCDCQCYDTTNFNCGSYSNCNWCG
jgi:hypothetical protein